MDTLSTVIQAVAATNGTGTIRALLAIVIAALVWDRRRIIKELDRKDMTLDAVLKKYLAGDIDTAEAMARIREKLVEISTKIKL